MNSIRSDYTTDWSASSVNDPKHNNMKKLLSAIGEYLRIGDEDTAIIISRSLQGLSVTIDLGIFDPHSNLASEFYSALYELMRRIEPRSQIAWYCVDLLSNACRNPSARFALINTYHFIPPLSRLLSDQLTVDKKIRLLRLMQELSCGIKISWQIPHLPHLLTTLAKWVECGHEEVVTLSLGVLVNMCYKNLPAIYTLSRHVDIKRFIRICMPLQGSVIEVHVCKLLIILDHMNSVVPENTLVKLMDSTFKWLREAFLSRDAILLRQIVEFFLDILKQDREAKMLDTYQRYGEEVQSLLQVLENNVSRHSSAGDIGQDPECVSIVFQFLHALTEKRLPQVMDHNSHFITLALKWIQTDSVSSQALNILKTVAMQTDASNKDILEPLVLGLPVFLLVLNSLRQDNIPTHSEHNKKIGGLFLLLRAMLQMDSIRSKVLPELQPDLLLRIFIPLIGDEDSPKMRAVNIETCSMDAVNLYVYAIALINELAKYDSVWINKKFELMKNREIDMILAQALFCSPIDVKQLVLEMASTPNFPSHVIAQAMGNMQSTILMNAPCSPTRSSIVNEINFPILSVAQSDSLDEILKQLQTARATTNMFNMATSEVMELYEYKISSMAQAERTAMVSVEATSEHCTNLQHRMAKQSAELNRLHQLLFRTQQCHEEAVKSKESLEATTKELKHKLEAEQGRNKASNIQMKHMEKMLQECQENGRKLAEMTAVKEDLDQQNSKLKQVINKLEENGTRLEKNLQKKEELLKKANTNIQELKMQVLDLETVVKNRDFELQTRTAELKEVTKDLMAKKNIIDTIMNVANSQIK